MAVTLRFNFTLAVDADANIHVFGPNSMAVLKTCFMSTDSTCKNHPNQMTQSLPRSRMFSLTTHHNKWPQKNVWSPSKR